jgi:hypothetical protein
MDKLTKLNSDSSELFSVIQGLVDTENVMPKGTIEMLRLASVKCLTTVKVLQ